MMSVALAAAPDHQQAECLGRGIGTLRGAWKQNLRRHHATVEPVDYSAAFDAADHANIGTGDFCEDFGYEKFRQTEGVGDHWRSVLNSHFDFPPHNAKANDGAVVSGSRLNSVVPAKIQFRVASCIVPAQGTPALVHSGAST